VALAIAGNVLGAIRFQDDTHTSTPPSTASSPRYRPHFQTAIMTSTGLLNGLTPSAPRPR
jgi:hypothetical protein